MVVRDYPESDWLSAMKNQSAHLQVNLDVTPQQLDDYLSQAKQALTRSLSKGIYRSGELVSYRTSDPLLPGFFLQNRLNMLVAEQGTGKSTFCLALFRSLVERTASFLDLLLTCNKNWELYLVGPDMTAEGWGPLLQANGLCRPETGTLDHPIPTDEEWKHIRLIPEVGYFSNAESKDSLSPSDIARYRSMALEAVGRGKSPLFVFDSYRRLVENYKDVAEIDSAFAGPLVNLQNEMAGTGATIIVLHHTTKSQTNAEKAGAGHNKLGSIPDVIVQMRRLNNNVLSSDKRLIIESAKRIDATNLLIEQTDHSTGTWVSHGEATTTARGETLIDTLAALSGPRQKIYLHMAELWDNQRKGVTTADIARFLEITIQGAGVHLRKLRKDHVIFEGDQKTGIHGNERLFYPFNAHDDVSCRDLKPNLKHGDVSQEPASSQGFDPVDPGLKHMKTGIPPYRSAETNFDGDPVPRKGLMVDVMKGSKRVNHHVIACDGMNPHNLSVAPLGQPNLVLKGRRWMVDVFPCLNNEEEEL